MHLYHIVFHIMLFCCYHIILFCNQLVRRVNLKAWYFHQYDRFGISQTLYFWRCKLSESYNLDAFLNLIPPRKLKHRIPPRKPRACMSLTVNRDIQRISDCRITWKIVRKKCLMFCLALESVNQCGASMIYLKKMLLHNWRKLYSDRFYRNNRLAIHCIPEWSAAFGYTILIIPPRGNILKKM